MTTSPSEPAPGRFERLLAARRFAMTAEITPPASCRKQDLLAKALPLKGVADAVNVTDGAGARAHISSVTAASLLVEAGIEPILQLTCRDRNRIALQGELLAAAATGVTNILMINGDPPSAGDQPDAKAVFDLDTRALMRTAATLRDRGELPPARKIAGTAHYFIGAADMPIDPPVNWSPDGLKAKIEAGAQFAQTQFCMDAGIARRYLQRLRDAGIPETFRHLIGIAPLRSVKSVRWMQTNLFGTIIPEELVRRMEQAADPAAEGRSICVELIQALSEIPGIGGVHVMAPAHDEAVPHVIAEARRRLALPYESA